MLQESLSLFQQHVSARGLNQSKKRDLVVEVFVSTNSHVSAQQLFDLLKEQYPGIGYTTVYRTLKLMVACGLANELDFGDGVKRYERKIGRKEHAHLICTRCGMDFEVFHNQISKLATNLAEEKNFELQHMRLEGFGLCRACRLLEPGIGQNAHG